MPLPTKILPTNLLDRVKRTRPVYHLGRRARFALGSRLGARYVPALRSRAHYNDFMLTSTAPAHVESYRRGAVEFVGLLGQALAEAGRDWTDVSACLEVGCGYGRIVRELCQVVPAGALAVCDVIDEGARFTAAEFGVRRVTTLDAMGPEEAGRYDLVYLLSVYTHLDSGPIEANLAAVAALLAPGGVLVFTTHGAQSAATAERYGQYWLNKAELTAELAATGFYYRRYPYYYADYGLTWMTTETTLALVAATAPALRHVAHHPLAVDGHQDLFVFQRD